MKLVTTSQNICSLVIHGIISLLHEQSEDINQ